MSEGLANYLFWRSMPGQREGEYTLPVMPPATVGPEGAPHVMGGVALAAAVEALQEESGQPLLWANIQFIAPTQHAEELSIRAEQCGGGQAVGQWLAEIRVNGRLTHRVAAALGARKPSEQTLFAAMPDVPAPSNCDPMQFSSHSAPGSLHDQIECRIAHIDRDKGIEAIWSRSLAEFPIDACWMAVVSDFFLGAHPQTRGGSSLDETLRFIRGAEPGWVLSVTEMAAFDRGVAHGSARHFAEDGQLLAISSQTGVLPRIPMMEG